MMRDEFFAIGHSLRRLRLSDEDLREIIFDILTKILDLKIFYFEKYKFEVTNLITGDEVSKDIPYLSFYIDFNNLSNEEIAAIHSQGIFFEDQIKFNQWGEYMDSLSQILKDSYYEVIKDFAIRQAQNPLEGYSFFCDLHYEIDLERTVKSTQMRNTYKIYDDYSLEVFNKSKQYLIDKFGDNIKAKAYNKQLKLNNEVQSSLIAETGKNKKIFITYAHESDGFREQVRQLSDWLKGRSPNLEIITDHVYEIKPPEKGWPIWMFEQIKSSDIVLLIASPKYYTRFWKQEKGTGKGVAFEGVIITQELYDAMQINNKFYPILLDGGDYNCIPEILRPFYNNWYFPSGNEEIYQLISF